MPRAIVNCPNCKRPVPAEIEQLFDLNQDPTAKQKLLSGAFNLLQCPHCGFRGTAAMPIVYHDPDKELLLTFVPPELGLPPNEQERMIGGLINQVMSRLPQEKRKAYLLRPQQTLTLQGLIERVLEADGITREMLQAQQQRLSLIQRLLQASSLDVQREIVRQEDQLIDEQFLALLERLLELSSASRDEQSARKLADLQKLVMEESSLGRELTRQVREVEEALRALKDAGESLDRKKLLEIVISAPNEDRLRALVSLARAGMDYQFFQLLSERIDRARGDGRARLVKLREQLLQLTQEYDQELAQRAEQARQRLERVLSEADVEQGLIKYSPVIDGLFLSVLNHALEEAEQREDEVRLEKLRKLVALIEKASAPSEEMQLIDQLLGAESEAEQRRILEQNAEKITPEFVNTVANLVYQLQQGENPDLGARLAALYKMMLRFSMERSLRASQ
ncbi:MAG: CpXC domain-containing protein [Anaerolineales bacterium]|nr:CpXC domain-containing protein [Anaerolineales bacterium]MDW8447987.1 CpXC domain-containing protein [Anaerolineales bacterium]